MASSIGTDELQKDHYDQIHAAENGDDAFESYGIHGNCCAAERLE